MRLESRPVPVEVLVQMREHRWIHESGKLPHKTIGGGLSWSNMYQTILVADDGGFTVLVAGDGRILLYSTHVNDYFD